MNKLMSANLMRLRKDKVFWICMVAMFGIGVAIALMTGGSHPEDFSIDKTFFAYSIPLGFTCAVFCSLFIGTDYSDGTIRNKIILGHSRVSVYLSNFFICAFAGIAFILAYIIPMLAIGIPRLGFFELKLSALFLLIGISIMMMLAICAICTLISMICQNKAIVAVACLLFMIVMLFIGAWLHSRLNEPEFYDSYAYTDNSGNMIQAPAEPNPYYLCGTKREVVQFVMELLPGGQAILLTDQSFEHTWQLPLYSLIIIVMTTSVGLCIFRKKDLR